MFQYYLIHYFNFKNAGGFMLVSLLCLIAVLAIVILAAKLKKHYKLNTQDLTHGRLLSGRNCSNGTNRISNQFVINTENTRNKSKIMFWYFCQ